MNYVDHKERDGRKVEEMFSRISHRYDLLNHVLSLGMDKGWRRLVAKETLLSDCRRILDVCTGTGDMAIELCRAWSGKAQIEGLDFTEQLLELGKRKAVAAGLGKQIKFRHGNAETLPYDDECFDAVTITFGLRNIRQRQKALKEFYRVTRKGGRFVCLEFTQPRIPVFSQIYWFYLSSLAPLISKLVGSDPGAYKYLKKTIKDFPSPDELNLLVSSVGWNDVRYRLLAFGTVAMHTAVKQ